MNISTDKDLWVSWREYHETILGLARVVHDSGWKFDQVLCLARGGLRPGDIFSRIFDVPLAILSVSSYREEAGLALPAERCTVLTGSPAAANCARCAVM